MSRSSEGGGQWFCDDSTLALIKKKSYNGSNIYKIALRIMNDILPIKQIVLIVSIGIHRLAI